MKKQYITPRLSIFMLTKESQIQKMHSSLELRHKGYYHIFNLSVYGSEKDSLFKWRGNPFSISQIVKIVTRIDQYLKINIANAAVICVSDQEAYLYALIIAKIYLFICVGWQEGKENSVLKRKIWELGQKLTKRQPFLIKEIHQIYTNVKIQSPPVKILQALEVHPSNILIPIPEIFTQGRYNQFQPIYIHPIQQQLASYYIQFQRPLQSGIGLRYYDQKPQTKYFKEPVLVYGDVKIKIYSYKYLKKVHQFTIGFNTLNIEELAQEKGVLVFGCDDLYDKNVEIKEDIEVRVTFSDFQKCAQSQQLTKKLVNRYNQCQSDLEKLHRVRKQSEISTLLSI